jgi:DNA-binding IclR family transcriptional regulator
MKGLLDDPFNNRSLVRAIHILSCFQFERPEIGLSELAAISGIPKATVHRLASTLVYAGVLNFDEQSKRYSLGIRLFELGSIVRASFSLTKAASPHLSRLHVKIDGHTVFLGVLRGDKLIYIDKREDASSIRFATNIGQPRPPHFGVLGQVLMAFLPEDEMDRLLKAEPLRPLTAKTITDSQLFKERVRLIRQQGYLVEEGEAFNMIAGIAAPVRDSSAKVVAAVGVGLLSSLVDYQGIGEIVVQTVNTAALISRDLGYLARP